MREYATTAEAWPENAPSNADSLLTFASLLVEDATRTAVYAVDAAGLPSNPVIRDVFRAATVAQAKFWDTQKLDPDSGAAKIAGEKVATSKSIGGASLNYSVSLIERGQQEKAATLHTLCPLAYRILQAEGLLNNRPVFM